MTDANGATHRLDPARRAAAIGALALAAAAVVVGAISLVGDVGRLIVALVLLLVSSWSPCWQRPPSLPGTPYDETPPR